MLSGGRADMMRSARASSVIVERNGLNERVDDERTRFDALAETDLPPTKCCPLAFVIAMSSANADVVFCNKFAHTVFVAIAYPQGDGSWMSRGWLELATGQCNTFDSAIVVKTFYFRGMTDPYRNAAHRRVVRTWGEGRTSLSGTEQFPVLRRREADPEVD